MTRSNFFNLHPAVITVKDRDSWSPGGTITIDSAGSVIPVGTTPTYTWTLMEAPPGSSHTAGKKHIRICYQST